MKGGPSFSFGNKVKDLISNEHSSPLGSNYIEINYDYRQLGARVAFELERPLGKNIDLSAFSQFDANLETTDLLIGIGLNFGVL